MKVDAVVLAGGDGAVIDPAAPLQGPGAGRGQADGRVGRRRACATPSTISEIAVVVPTAENLGAWADKVDKLVVSDGNFIDNVIAGIAAFSSGRHVFCHDRRPAGADCPRRSTTSSLARSRAGADFTYPLVREEDVLEQFPGSRAHLRQLVDRQPVTGGNMMLMAPGVVERNREIGQRLFDTRKSPVAWRASSASRSSIRLVDRPSGADDVEDKMEELLGGTLRGDLHASRIDRRRYRQARRRDRCGAQSCSQRRIKAAGFDGTWRAISGVRRRGHRDHGGRREPRGPWTEQ